MPSARLGPLFFLSNPRSLALYRVIPIESRLRDAKLLALQDIAIYRCLSLPRIIDP